MKQLKERIIYNDIMPITPINYSNTIIYRIFSDNCDYVYVGSTTDITRRKSTHKHACNTETNRDYNYKVYEIIRANGGWNEFKMLEIEEYPCESSKQARKREQYWIDFYKAALNSRKSFGAETKQEYQKQHRVEHAEEIKEHRKQYRSEHAEEIKEYQKEYRIEHKEENKEYQKQYQFEHAEEIKEYQKKYRKEYCIKNAEEFKQKVTCECGAIVTKQSLAKHKKRQIHLDAL